MNFRERKKLINTIFKDYGEVYKIHFPSFWVRTSENFPRGVRNFLYDWIVSAFKGDFEKATDKRKEVIRFWEKEAKERADFYVPEFLKKIPICKNLLHKITERERS